MFNLSIWELLYVELSVLAVGTLAALWGRWQDGARRIESSVAGFAGRPILCFLGLASASILLRVALLPIEPVPMALFHDEFSYLLGADTLAHWRLTNPAPPVPIAFETIHILNLPTYQSVYMPGTALVLAIGKLAGLPWLSVLLVTALLCGTVYWMVSGWLPRAYGLAAGVLAIGITGTMNWWFDNYFCIALTSLGTALVIGSLPRIAVAMKARWALLLGLGLTILMLTRPLEGCCVTLPCVGALLWYLRGAGWRKVVGLGSAAVCVVLVGFAWLLFYNWRGTGHPLLFPYMVDLREYHITGPFLFSLKRALPAYDLDVLRRFYIFAEVPQYDFMKYHPWLFLAKKICVYYMAVLFGFFIPMMGGVIYLVFRHRERLWIAPVLGFCGFVLNVILMAWSPFPQYAGPAFSLLLLLVAFGFYGIRRPAFQWRGFTGRRLTRGLVVAELMLGLSLFGYRVSDSRNFPEPQYVSRDRAAVLKQVTAQGGKQLCMVRYTPMHESWKEWVFNGAELQSESVVWARSLDPETDREVIRSFPGRTVWLVEPDYQSPVVRPYVVAPVSSNQRR